MVTFELLNISYIKLVIMKKAIFTALAAGFISLSFTAAAQDEKSGQQTITEKSGKHEKKETQEIIIKSDGDKAIKLNVEIDGDNVLINGKPLNEFIDKDVSINKRKMIIRDGNGGNMTFNFDGNLDGPGELPWLEEMDKFKDFKRNNISHKSFLGVTTEKANDGAKIIEVLKGSAAENAGLKKDDVITKIGAEPVTDATVLAEIISQKKPKEPVKIYFKRDGKNKEVKAVLGNRTEERNKVFNYKNSDPFMQGFNGPHSRSAPMPNSDMMKNFNMEGNFNFGENGDIMGNMFPRQKKLGLKIQDTEEGDNVKVIDVEDSSAAQKAGLKKDDFVTEINGERVSNTDEVRAQLQAVADKSAYTIKAKRNGTEMSFDIKIPKKLKTANL